MEQAVRIKRGIPLLMWRVGLIGIVTLLFGALIQVSQIINSGRYLLGVSVAYLGIRTLFQRRKGFSFLDHVMAILVGLVLLIVAYTLDPYKWWVF